ncbi:DUF3299 domain-containing protein [Shewanella sp. Scap07]|uniref:DUF3299 domain-containing protein n=1 Tax=Shewanella sp. Scap07 TaxID=2589987 RepID=UPI0015BA3B42|nr:DUF3299 domain-containing protein [Shewanella sp. Scap07]QLE86353.1 DUF3299 domain-containing protein [Shewanella sp. Scap07]
MKRLVWLMSVFSALSFAEPLAVSWSALAPDTNEKTVTLPDVTEQQKRLLAQVILLSDQASNAEKEKLQSITAELAEQGIDVAAALAARTQYMQVEQRKAEALNPQFNGRFVRLSGFVVPTKFNGVKATEFLLMPYAGACIHMPPPPANQVIKLSYPEGFEVQNVQYPVWVEGVIETQLVTENVQLVDGKMPVTMGYALNAQQIERYYHNDTELMVKPVEHSHQH